MNTRAPLLNRSGYVLDSRELKILQREGWLALPLTEIAEVKKPSLTTAIVRLGDGRTQILDLAHLSTKGFSEVVDALREAARHRRAVASHAPKA